MTCPWMVLGTLLEILRPSLRALVAGIAGPAQDRYRSASSATRRPETNKSELAPRAAEADALAT